MANGDAISSGISPSNDVQKILDERVALENIGVGSNSEALSSILRDFENMQKDAKNLI